MTSNNKIVNKKVVDLAEPYNIDIKFVFIWFRMKKLCIYTCFSKICSMFTDIEKNSG
jgi:hypothetical protein